jgi:hypothetical protein
MNQDQQDHNMQQIAEPEPARETNPGPQLAPATPNKGGRPRIFDRQTALSAICDGLESGTPMTVICAQEGMPTPRQVTRWAEADNEVRSALARARDLGFDAIAADALRIADEIPAIDTVEAIQRAKLKIETRLKLLACWSKRYNPASAGSTTTVKVGVQVVGVMSDEEREGIRMKKQRAIAFELESRK